MASGLLQNSCLKGTTTVRCVHRMRLTPATSRHPTPFRRPLNTKPDLSKPIVFPKDPRSMRNDVPAPSVLSSLPIFKWLSEEGQEKQRKEVHLERKAKERHEAKMKAQGYDGEGGYGVYGGDGYGGGVHESGDQAELAEQKNANDSGYGTHGVGGDAGTNGDIVNGSDFTGIGFSDDGGGGFGGGDGGGGGC